MKNLFKAFENWLEKIFCQQPAPSSSGGGRKDGMTDAERTLENDKPNQ